MEKTFPRWVPAKPGNPMPIRRSVPFEIWGGTQLLFDAPSVRLAALAPMTLAATHAPLATTQAATHAPLDTTMAATHAPTTSSKGGLPTSAWLQSTVRNSVTNNPDNDKDNAQLSSLSGELRALALQREKIDTRLKDNDPDKTERVDDSDGSA